MREGESLPERRYEMKKTEYITAVRETGVGMEYRRVWQGDDGHYYVKKDGKWWDITGTKSEQMMTVSDRVWR